MSGVFGLFNQNKSPVLDSEIRQMALLMSRRGPDRTGSWNGGSIGLGHTLLATTPEALEEYLPLLSPASGCVITADVRLDNRTELLERLALSHKATSTGDAELILAAYHAWNTSCVDHLRGDFAFAIWDPRIHRLFCARDHFGIKPLYYHHTPGHFFVFASEPRALLVLPQVPYRINEGRIADFLITQLEGIDKTSTFFEDVYRLPPAHTLTITPEGMQKERYWTLEPPPELKLSSDEEYAEAFLEVFTEAVRCRLNGNNVGSMLSGGMDSSSVVAVAREILAREGRGPLPTFSAISSRTENCVETRAIKEAMAMEGVTPHTVDCEKLDDMLPELNELIWSITEPFDSHMSLLFAVYLTAHRQGINALLDGIDGDTILSEGSYVVRLLQQGRLFTACGELAGLRRFWGDSYPFGRELYRSVRQAFVPESLKCIYRNFNARRGSTLARNIEKSIINPVFAKRVRLAERLKTLAAQRSSAHSPDPQEEYAKTINQPWLTAGIERYNRVASATGVEPRHPFLDLRVATFCLSLPARS